MAGPRPTRMAGGRRAWTLRSDMTLTTSSKLTPREHEVLGLLALGFTNREVAEELNISVRTVETHRASILSMLGLRTRADLVRYARANGVFAG